EFVDCVGVMLDLGEREFLAQLVALPTVTGEVDRLGVEERFVEPVELLQDRLGRFDSGTDEQRFITMYPRWDMPFDMYGDAIPTSDVTESGLRAGDLGTVVERHVAPGVPGGRLLSRVRRHDRQHSGRSRVAGERPAPSHTGRSSRCARPQRLRVGLTKTARP